MDDFNFHRIIGMVTACAVMPNVFADSPIDLEGKYNKKQDPKI